MATTVTHIVDPDNGPGTNYTSLQAWEAAQQRDLVAADEIAVAECRCTSGGNDTGGLDIGGWTTDATRYIQIHTTAGGGYRHAGVWDNTKYVLELGSWDEWAEDYVRVFGLQIDVVDGFGNWTSSAGEFQFAYNIVINGELNTNAPVWKLWNCIFYDCGARHSINVFTSYMYNCIMYGDGTHAGVRAWSGTLNVVNCAVWNMTDDFDAGTTSVSYSASDDGDGANSVQPSDWTAVFENITTRDFRLKTTDTDLTDAGTDNPGSGLFPDDITGKARISPWSIGAHGTQAAGGGTGQCLVGAIGAVDALGNSARYTSISVPAAAQAAIAASAARSDQAAVTADSAASTAGTGARAATSLPAAASSAQAIATSHRSSVAMVAAASGVSAAGTATEAMSGTVAVAGAAGVTVSGTPMRYVVSSVSAVSAALAAGTPGDAGPGVVIDPVIESLSLRRSIGSLTMQRSIHSI